MIGAVLRMPKTIVLGWLVLMGNFTSSGQDLVKSSYSFHSSAAATTTSHNRSPKAIRPLSVGDKVPDIEFHNVLNYKSRTAKLSDFKGKLVIMDMWSTYCTSCIAGFPKMDALQKEFKDKIQILLVNPTRPPRTDSEEKINKILDNIKVRSGFYPSLPIPIKDSLIKEYFPHQTVPHVIWIDGEGTVINITDSKEVNAKNITAVLTNEKTRLNQKNDWAYNPDVPLLVDGNGGDNNRFIYRSLFTGYTDGIPSIGNRKNDKNEVIGYYLGNISLVGLINHAYADVLNDISESQRIYDVTDLAKFKASDSKNVYCYDLTIPPVSVRSFNPKRYLRDDLKRVFNIDVYKERRKLQCKVFRLARKIDFTKFNSTEVDIESSSIKKYIHRYPIGKLIPLFGYYINELFIDETGLSDKNIDIDFPDNFDLEDGQAVLTLLKKIGFEIREEKREMDVVIITDKK